MEELGARKQAILKEIVEAYIRTGEPVGSKWLFARLENAVSSATVRNEMADLTALGYLSQPHTSAGRLPTAEAMRLYVDRLMTRRPLEKERQEEIDRRLSLSTGDPERLLGETTRLLSETTGYAALTAAPAAAGVLLKAEMLRMSERTVMLAVMTASGALRSRFCRIDGDLSNEALRRLSDAFARLAGQPLRDISRAQMQTLLSSLGENSLQLAGIVDGFYEMIGELQQSDVHLTGEWRLLQNPDYPSETIRQLLGFLSKRERLSAMLSACPREMQVLLGSESRCPELSGSSVILTRYSSGGRSSGSLGLIGPVRMDYARTIPQMEYLAKTVSRLLSAAW